jgi:hypothetical protein
MTLRRALWAGPLLVLVMAYAAICWRFGSLAPFGDPVHEDGRHTLVRTVFYFEHAAGELPLEWLLSLGIAGAVARRCAAGAWRKALAAALGIDVLILAGAVSAVGWSGVLPWLFQFQTRHGAAPEFGAHWRYHLLSLAALLLGARALAEWSGGGVDRRLWPVAWLAFGALSLAFGWNAVPLTDARYLGHQARETFTHALVTVPLAIAVCPAAADPSVRRALPWAAAFTLLAGYQAAGVLWTGAGRMGQTSDPVRLVAAHFFEHTLSYAVVALHTLAFCRLAAARGGKT